uniref:Uncharacterized protein n=1 Tax=Anguilla anguilla TaxID=7936 RepID=A0A0E9WJK5_ANGAN
MLSYMHSTTLHSVKLWFFFIFSQLYQNNLNISKMFRRIYEAKFCDAQKFTYKCTGHQTEERNFYHSEEF